MFREKESFSKEGSGSKICLGSKVRLVRHSRKEVSVSKINFWYWPIPTRIFF